MFEILKEKTLFDNKLVIEEGKIVYNKNTKYSRLRLKREDAAAVLILNTDSNKVILTKQFRYAIASKTKEHILEIMAGKIGKGEKPEEAVIRETKEETGYKIRPDCLRFLLSCFSTPGYSSERFFIYYATVTNLDKISENLGLKNENEYIKLVEMDIIEFTTRIRNGKIKDAKTYIAGLYVILQLINLKLDK